LASLGDIPPARIRLNPPPGCATEADVLAVEANVDQSPCELIDGTLVEKAMGFTESLLAAFLVHVLREFVVRNKLGIVTTADGMVRILPGQIRIPDVAYFSWDQLPGRKVPTARIPPIAPTLAIEILSPSNTIREMERKRRDYFSAGTDEVWEVAPATRSVHRYLANGELITLNEHECLATTLLPGFNLALAELFAVLDEQG
jgi:Uma2 family endonuclease